MKTERFDPESLWNRVDGDMGLLRELVEVFAEEGPRMLARIDDAIRHGSARELEKASHKMKGSVLQFSASAAASVAFELEEKGKCGLVAGAEQLSHQLKQEIELLQKSLNAMAYSDTTQ
ncbi:MAG TPA: Hpt domain-containing protein [Candidatus Angelobacter sp.]|nr:Hpt domain-containing protein [Candidatus Angelobacter sp.]